MHKLSIKILRLILPAFMSPVLANVTDLPVKSAGDLLFYFDTASFRAREQQTSQEFYYQIPLSELAFQASADSFRDTLAVSFEITDQTRQVLLQDRWLLPVQVLDLHAVEGRFLPDFFEITLNPGNYQAKMEITHQHSNRTGKAKLNLIARKFPNDALCLSDIQFCSQINREKAAGKFLKNSLEAIPNPNRVFGKTLPLLYFYTEFYNLPSADTAGSYSVNYEILTQDSARVKMLPIQIKKKAAAHGLEAGAMSLAALKNSGYLLKISLKDNDTRQQAQAIRGFWNITPRVAEAPLVTDSLVIKYLNQMSEADLDIHFRQLKYIMPPNEIKIINTLPLEALRKFLINFWHSLDPNSETIQNEFRDEFQRRVKYADQNYSTGFQEGWRTDCGRIVIKYGIPGEIKKEALRTRGKPYEEWFYNLEGGLKFIFIDEDEIGRYRLIYSSVNSEFTDPNWQNILNEE